ncbi:MAG: hypothetical protein WBN70_06870 [Polyangiales bacterium]
MSRLLQVLWVLGVLGLVAACGSSDGDGGGTIDSNEALRGMMQVVALDFAQVLADVAPSPDALAQKQDGATDCPEGGSAVWNDTGFGGGTLSLDGCRMSGVAVTGTLSGFVESGPDYVDGSMMRGPITTTGGYAAELNVTNLIVSAQLPPTEDFTYWEIRATTPGGMSLCAWSGGSGCAPSPF